MKLHELKEMAIRGGNLTSQAEEHAKRMEVYLKDAKHIGDIDSFQVKQKGKEYGVYKGDELVAIANLDPIPNAYSIIDNLWVKESFRGKKILAKLLWFFKSRENHNKILFGKGHTDDTVDLLKANGLSLFKKYWFDPITGKEEKFDPNTVDDYYGSGKSRWSLMLEHNGDDSFLNMPKFNTLEAGYISQAYDWQIANHE
jgi:hypothetical protein